MCLVPMIDPDGTGRLTPSDEYTRLHPTGPVPGLDVPWASLDLASRARQFDPRVVDSRNTV